jgi:hypothetical protein
VILAGLYDFAYCGRPLRAALQARFRACHVGNDLLREVTQDRAKLGHKPIRISKIIPPVGGEEKLYCPRYRGWAGFRTARQAVLLLRRRRIASEMFHGFSR